MTKFFLGLYFLLTLSQTGWGFVLLSSKKSTLPATPLNPEVVFVWDGNAPEIKDKDKFLDGQYANLSDKELMKVLLQFSLERWSNVRGAYVRLKLDTDHASTAKRSTDDKINSIECSLLVY